MKHYCALFSFRFYFDIFYICLHILLCFKEIPIIFVLQNREWKQLTNTYKSFYENKPTTNITSKLDWEKFPTQHALSIQISIYGKARIKKKIPLNPSTFNLKKIVLFLNIFIDISKWKTEFYIQFHFYSFNKLLLQKEELEQKHVHLLQVVESEKTAKWQYSQQCEELASEIRKLRSEVI